VPLQPTNTNQGLAFNPIIPSNTARPDDGADVTGIAVLPM